MSYVKTFLLAIFILSCSSAVFAETITMTTYYPSPSGNYGNMNVTGSVIFTTGGQSYFAGISGGSLYFNAGAAAAATGMTIASDGRMAVNKPTATAFSAGIELEVFGDFKSTSVTTGPLSAGAITGQTLTINPGASSLKAVGATTITATSVATTTWVTAATSISAGTTLSSGGNTTVGDSLTVTNSASVGIAGLNVGNAAAGDVKAHAFMHWSDERLKEKIVPITGAIEKVKAINGVYFKYKGKEEQNIGLIAQNVEKVVPEVVGTDSEGMKTVDYSSLVPLLIEAVKEQQVIIDELQGKGHKNK
jgi:hypothetical protein